MTRSHTLYERARRIIPGGVNSPVRAFRGVDGEPLFFHRAEGPYIFDVDGKQYIDFVGSWGPLILGHRHSVVEQAIQEALTRGTSFGAPTEREVEFAELLCTILPGVEMIRMVNSGTEATMSALRLARAFTRRDIVIKFDGCYHGHGDSFLVSAGSGLATLGIASSPGVPQTLAALTRSIEYNDLALLDQTLVAVGAENIAAIIVEPVAGNMGLVLPRPNFLAGLRERCSRHGIVLIFDEVMTGFRVALGGAAERFGITPDLSTFGKVIGGGLPVGAFGGRREIMNMLAPEGSVYQAGTLSGNPLAMAAGMAAVQRLQKENPYPLLDERSANFVLELKTAAEKVGVSLQTSSCGSMIGFYFSQEPVTNYTIAKRSRVDLFKKFFHGMLEQGVYLAPSAFEAGFLSIAHDENILKEVLEKAAVVFQTLPH